MIWTKSGKSIEVEDDFSQLLEEFERDAKTPVMAHRTVSRPAAKMRRCYVCDANTMFVSCSDLFTPLCSACGGGELP